MQKSYTVKNIIKQKGELNMKWRTVVILFLVVNMILNFAGCARQSEADTQNETSTQEEQNQEIQHPMESESESNSPVTEQTDSNPSEQQKEEQNLSEEEEPTESELTELFDRAMYEINNLATTEIDYLLSEIFEGDIECDYSNQITINGVPYQWTSRRYSELVDYYSQTFTGEALD